MSNAHDKAWTEFCFSVATVVLLAVITIFLIVLFGKPKENKDSSVEKPAVVMVTNAFQKVLLDKETKRPGFKVEVIEKSEKKQEVNLTADQKIATGVVIKVSCKKLSFGLK
jgi:hypothetical protein